MPQHLRPCVLREAVDCLVILARESFEEVTREDHDIGPTKPKRWHLDMNDVESVVEVLSKPPFRHLDDEILVRRRDEPDVDIDGPSAADALDRLVLQHLEQLHLHQRRDLADLV